MRALVVALLLLLPACNRRVFEFVEPQCGPTINEDLDLAVEKADILIVVDNSGSMQEEQDEIARNFLNDDPSCPIPVDRLAEFASCDQTGGEEGEEGASDLCRFHRPSDTQLAEELATCGFLQVLAAFDVDFRVGVITTDVGICDNRFVELGAPADWGHHPQRGCLQPDDAGRKLISRADLDDGDPAVRNLGARFTSTLADIRTFGSGVERGLDAVDLFFDPRTNRHPSCEGDQETFLRDDAKLIVLFLTDEEDCSHTDAGPFECEGGCTDERFAEFVADQCGDNRAFIDQINQHNCYTNLDKLTPTSVYANRLRELKPDPNDVAVAVIAGGVFDADAEQSVRASGCNVDGEGAPAADCEPLAGRARSDCPECCVADGGARYFEFADEVGGIKDSICFSSYRRTMIEIAAFIGAVDSVRFDQPPKDARLVFIQKNGEPVPRLEGQSCDERDGWLLLDDARTVVFCGSARPASGDQVKVRAALEGKCG